MHNSLNIGDELFYYTERFLVCTVACAINHNLQNHLILVITGPESIGKTRWLQRLVPSALGDYYYQGFLDPKDKDSNIRMSDSFIINIDELDALSKNEIPRLKAFITSPESKVRAAYKAQATRFPRRA